VLVSERISVKKEFVITEIRAATDGAPFVYVTLSHPDEVGTPQRAPPFAGVASFSSLEDMMKNLGPTLSRQMFGSTGTMIKLGLDEYETLDVNVGDRVALEIQKVHIGIS
jgi:hypothetical protein